jgi:transcriptional regulator with XRE-family HTH domain
MNNKQKKNRIEEALRLRGVKQVELVEKTGIKKASINHWIKQRYQPKQDSLYKMARALDVSELWLAGYDVPMERAPEQIKADKLATLIHQLRGNDNLIRLMTYAVKLNDKQLVIVESMIKELIKADR